MPTAMGLKISLDCSRSSKTSPINLGGADGHLCGWGAYLGQLDTAQKVFRRLKHSSEYGRRSGVDQGKPHTLEYALEGGG